MIGKRYKLRFLPLFEDDLNGIRQKVIDQVGIDIRC